MCVYVLFFLVRGAEGRRCKVVEPACLKALRASANCPSPLFAAPSDLHRTKKCVHVHSCTCCVPAAAAAAAAWQMSANANAHSSSRTHSRSPVLALNRHKEAFSARALELRGLPEKGVLRLPVESGTKSAK